MIKNSVHTPTRVLPNVLVATVMLSLLACVGEASAALTCVGKAVHSPSPCSAWQKKEACENHYAASHIAGYHQCKWMGKDAADKCKTGGACTHTGLTQAVQYR